MMELVGFVSVVCMGVVLGVVGAGGSILTVPIFVYLFAMPPSQATAGSLLVVGLTALLGGVRRYQKGEANGDVAMRFVIPSLVAVTLTRRFILPALPDPVFATGHIVVSKDVLLMATFAVLMATAAIAMLRRRPSGQSAELAHAPELTSSSPDKRVSAASPGHAWMTIVPRGLFVGFVTAFVGAGGGFLVVPVLVVTLGMAMREAVGTSLLIVATNSLFAFSQAWPSANDHIPLLLGVAGLAALGMLVGLRLTSRWSEVTLRRGFGVFVLVMGSYILLDQVRHIL